jgi:hypothetical protein
MDNPLCPKCFTDMHLVSTTYFTVDGDEGHVIRLYECHMFCKTHKKQVRFSRKDRFTYTDPTSNTETKA